MNLSQVVVHIHNGVLAVKRNASESVLMRWMNLEPTIQSEVSQREKDKYCLLTYMESRKMILKTLFAGEQWRNRHREQTYGHEERGGEGEICGDSNMEILLLCFTETCKICCMSQETQNRGSVST